MASVVRSSFGPRPQEKLLVTATNRAILTRSGASILASLVCTHPVARWVLDAVAGHVARTGDGATSFVLLLCSALEEADIRLQQRPGLRRQLVRAIDWVRQVGLTPPYSMPSAPLTRCRALLIHCHHAGRAARARCAFVDHSGSTDTCR